MAVPDQLPEEDFYWVCDRLSKEFEVFVQFAEREEKNECELASWKIGLNGFLTMRAEVIWLRNQLSIFLFQSRTFSRIPSKKSRHLSVKLVH